MHYQYTEAELDFMSENIQLETVDGKVRLAGINCDVSGSVNGTVYGNVGGDVCGDVGGSVGGKYPYRRI